MTSLSTARIDFNMRDMTARLITGGESYRDQSHANIDIFDAFALATRELPEEDKAFFIKDLFIHEMPIISRQFPITCFAHKMFIYEVLVTRQEANEALRKMLALRIDDIYNPAGHPGYPRSTAHGRQVPRGI